MVGVCVVLCCVVLFIENVKDERKEERKKEGRGWYMVADCVMLMMKEREKE